MHSQNNISHANRDVRTYVDPNGGVPRPRPPFRPADASAHSSAPKGKFIAKGHDAQLQDAQFSKHVVIISLTDGTTIRGYISKRDKFTITLNHSEGTYAGQDEIFYKHAIQGVLVLRSENKSI